jgi:hypothetical protein
LTWQSEVLTKQSGPQDVVLRLSEYARNTESVVHSGSAVLYLSIDIERREVLDVRVLAIVGFASHREQYDWIGQIPQP